MTPIAKMPPEVATAGVAQGQGRQVAAGLLAEVSLASTQRIAGVYELQRKLDRVIDQTIVNLTVATSFDFERPGPMLTAQMVTASMIVELEVDYVASCQACLELLGC